MVLIFALIGGMTGFTAALVTLFLGHGFWQAMANYWQIGTLTLLTLILLHLILTLFRKTSLGTQILTTVELKFHAFAFDGLEPARVKQAALKPHQH